MKRFDKRFYASWFDCVYQSILQLIFIPFIKRHFEKLLDKSGEILRVCIVSAKYEFSYGTEKKYKRNEDEVANEVTLYIYNPMKFCFRVVVDSKIGLGESFMEGDWDAEPSPKHFLTSLIRAKHKDGNKIAKADVRSSASSKFLDKLLQFIFWVIQKIAFYINYLEHRIRRNTVEGSAANIRDHYDLGNDMFQKFLDPSMTYSCAIFELPLPEVTKSNVKLLEEAQTRKYYKILDQLNLKATDSILEIGCGWGAFAITAVEKYGCQWTGLTISKEQFSVAQQRVKEHSLQDKIQIKLLDYRLVDGTYDRVIAIEMIEAVGHEFLPQFFDVINQRLKPGGISFVQAIVCPDAYYDRYRRSSDFIKKYIFPGGHMPSMKAIEEALPKALKITEVDHFGRHYAVTLDFWNLAWMEQQNEIMKLGYPLVFHRKWQFYFALCSALFEYDHIGTVHVKFLKCVA